MHGLSIENRTIAGDQTLSSDLAHRILSRCYSGGIAVVAEHPTALLSSVRKQWLKLIRVAQREKASTLDPRRRYELDLGIEYMQEISFTAQDPASDPVARVSFATVEQFRLFPPQCATLYITCPTQKIDQHMLTSWMQWGGVVVIYG